MMDRGGWVDAMPQTQQKDYTLDELETSYQDIAVLYDYAEELVGTVESHFVSDSAKQLEIVEPLINELGDATDALTEEFLLLAEGRRQKGPSKASRTRIEASFRKIYASLNEYQARVKDITKKAHGAIQNIADPIVEKIQRQVEKVVALFLDFIQLSLHNVMGHAELAQIKARETRVALYLHQMSQQQGQQQ